MEPNQRLERNEANLSTTILCQQYTLEEIGIVFRFGAMRKPAPSLSAWWDEHSGANHLRSKGPKPLSTRSWKTIAPPFELPEHLRTTSKRPNYDHLQEGLFG
ncbi:hypothetical protein BC938DRAFT_476844 [Jimgerdemannia flammicorona]|uniref:Uncharacterized protein n=1 Tax=Jimgerdemannia flammicorona TaxID=994334 RepID=A0A433QQ05_9FUNG|nr:hypothetical protein BC938DRAFT_476844 [Jimgerdemannia flammicorona]